MKAPKDKYEPLQTVPLSVWFSVAQKTPLLSFTLKHILAKALTYCWQGLKMNMAICWKNEYGNASDILGQVRDLSTLQTALSFAWSSQELKSRTFVYVMFWAHEQKVEWEVQLQDVVSIGRRPSGEPGLPSAPVLPEHCPRSQPKGLNNEIPQMPRFQSKITLHIKNQEDLKLTLEKIASGQEDRDVIGQFKAAIAIESLSKEIKG